MRTCLEAAQDKQREKNKQKTGRLQTTNLDVWELVATFWFSILGHAFNLASVVSTYSICMSLLEKKEMSAEKECSLYGSNTDASNQGSQADLMFMKII